MRCFEWSPEPSRECDSRIDSSDPSAVELVSASITLHMQACRRAAEPVVVVCIGTDRSTGDALGPLVGTSLRQLDGDALRVFGTLDDPVHAANLADVLRRLPGRGSEPFVLAVDACLGQSDQVGTIAVGPGPVRPGAGVNKVLPAVGSVHVTGTVNVGGFMEYLVLQNTRLSLVMRMARVISQGIVSSIRLCRGTDATDVGEGAVMMPDAERAFNEGEAPAHLPRRVVIP